MANPHNSTGASGIAAMEATAVARAEGLKLTAQLLADQLARVMADIHGGTWQSVIDHGADSSFVLIRPNLDKSIQKPRGGEAA